MTSETNRPPSPFGVRLRQWRRHRGLSQLELATRAGTTARHLSFLETGRSRPSRDMVLRLSEVIGAPLRERNVLLQAAGLAATFPEENLDGADLAPFRATIDRILQAHMPFPAMLVDAHWNVVVANAACATLYGELAGANIIRRYFADAAASAAAIVNWPEVAWAGVSQLRQQLLQTPFDPELTELVAMAERAVADLARPTEFDQTTVLSPWIRVGDQVVRTIGMVARFDAPADVTLDELRIELIYPFDPAAERFFRRSGQQVTST